MFNLDLEKAEEQEIKLPTSAGSSKKQESSRKISISAEKTLENPLNCKEIKPVHPKGNQSCIFIGKTDAEADTPILWSPAAKNLLIGKDPAAGQD